MEGELGVVSGTGIDTVLARKLQLGDAEGHLRRALSHFPRADIARRVLDRWFKPGGKSPDEPFKLNSMPCQHLSKSQVELLIAANFAEVFLAKEGHDGLVGINYLEKIQITTLPSLLGAMLAKADFVLMGAGIPRAIPGLLDKMALWEPVELKLQVTGNESGVTYSQHLNPRDYRPAGHPELHRPKFIAIVSSDTVATALARKSSGVIDGFVIENHTAGGHNAPPRKAAEENPQFGERDIPDLAKVRRLNKPFWLAGSYGSPVKFKEALDHGAHGIQVGTAFAFCRESGIMPEIKAAVILEQLASKLRVCTDFRASPTGFPFKMVHLADGEPARNSLEERQRICDLGYLRELYERGRSRLGYRCPAEPVESYSSKGGRVENTVGRQCLCNGLMATIGIGQVRDGRSERPMITAGEDFSFLSWIPDAAISGFSAKDVLDYLRAAVRTAVQNTSRSMVPNPAPGGAV